MSSNSPGPVPERGQKTGPGHLIKKGYRGMPCKCSGLVLNGVFRRKKASAGEWMHEKI